MSYLDPKERVIDIEITSYGRYLLANGRFNPAHYAFFDDDIIYDAGYKAGSPEENQSNIEPRIQENTPRFSAQAVYSGRDLAVYNTSPNVYNDLIIGQDLENLKESDKQAALQQIKVQDQVEKTEIMQQPLGKSSTQTRYLPAWNATFLKAPLSSSSAYLTGTLYVNKAGKTVSGAANQNIPQLNADLEYNLYRLGPESKLIPQNLIIGDKDPVESEAPGDLAGMNSLTFADGSSISLGQDALIVRLEESNTLFENENFEIECFEIQTDNGIDYLTPLAFYKDQNRLANDLEGMEIEPGTVEEYFIMEVDSEIEDAVICPFIRQDKSKIFYQTRLFECEKRIEEFGTVNTYSDVDDQGDLCDD